MPNGENLAISLALDMRAKFCISLPHGGNQYLAVNTTKLVNFIAQDTGTDLEIKVVSDLGDLRGMFARKKNNKALIILGDSSVNTECWERFTLIKEACHLFLDTDESFFNTDINKKVDGLISREIENHHYSTEIEAVLAAVELLIPREFSTKIASMSNVEKKTSFEIASYFKVPLIFMEYRMERLDIDIIRK